MNPEEFKKENKNSRRYILYFFYGWLFFVVLICILFKLDGYHMITNQIWDWLGLIFVPALLSLMITPLIILAARKELRDRVKAYLKRILFPIYLFPIKLVTFSLYYLIRFVLGLIVSLLKIIRDFIIFPFRSIKNLLKSFFIVVLTVYVAVSFFVNADYLTTHYGYYKNFFGCPASYGVNNSVNEKIRNSVVRIVGGYSEGSGFFIQPDQIVTNFHIIADEPSPKIIFPDGSFIVPERIIGDKDMDLAIIFTEKKYPEMELEFSLRDFELYENEALFATGYAMGTNLLGSATQLRGNLMDAKRMSRSKVDFIQTDINLASGMSGGPLTNLCGIVIGVSAKGLGGTSLFIPIFKELSSVDSFTDKDIQKIEVNPAASPEEAVKAFYTYLKARKMEEGFNLLSKEYLNNTNFEEWSSRFENVIDVDVVKSERYEDTKDTVSVKFITKNWVDSGVIKRYYEGTWTMVMEDGVYKIQKGKILEVDNPEMYWFYD